MTEATNGEFESAIATILGELRSPEDALPFKVLIRRASPGEFACQGFHRGEKYPESRIVQLIELTEQQAE